MDKRTTKQRYYKAYSLARRWNKTKLWDFNALMPQAYEAFKARFKRDDLPSFEYLLTKGLK